MEGVWPEGCISKSPEGGHLLGREPAPPSSSTRAGGGGGETRGRFEGYIDEKSGTRKYETGNGGGRTWKEGSPGCFDLSKGQRDFDSCTRTKVHARTSIQLRRSRWNPKHLLSPQPCTATDVVVLARGAQLLCEHSQLAGRAGIRR